MLLREEIENREREILARYALKSAESRGRRHPEPKHPYRTEFQRDRDRIVHSTAFRRLQYKTQVFVNHEGDHYRTRLTHTMEVAIIARSITRALRLNEDLTEAIALAHDLGHTPFGHSGEEALNELLIDKDGFEHNRQCIRVVDLLEQRYPDFPGLNLSHELREGILKHRSDYDYPDLPDNLRSQYGPSLECQVVNIADEIAYNCHDIDDGLSSGVIIEDQLADVELCRRQMEWIASKHPNLDIDLRRHIMVRRLIDDLVTDLVNQSSKNIAENAPENPEDIAGNHLQLLAFSESKVGENNELKIFLRANMYKHPRMVHNAEEAKRIIIELYDKFVSNPDVLPPRFRARLKEEPLHLIAADYIAGMTDRFAHSEHERLTGSTP